MKKKQTAKNLIAILFLSLLPLFVFFLDSRLVHTHDGLVHLPRLAAWFKALGEGQIPVRWAGDLNYGYGTPVLIFMYPWPYFLGSLFLGLGMGLVGAFKSVLALSFLVSGITFFLFADAFFQSKEKAFLATVFYQFTSFRLVEMITRGAAGEVWTYAFLPLALWGLLKIFSKQKMKSPSAQKLRVPRNFEEGSDSPKDFDTPALLVRLRRTCASWSKFRPIRLDAVVLSGFLLTAFATGLLILSHNSVSLSFFLILLLFILFFGKRMTDYLLALTALGMGLALAAFYWLPALWERQYTYGDLFMKDLYLDHFPSLKQLFWPNLFNQSFGQVHHVAVQIGFFPLLALGLATFFLFKRKLKERERKTVLFSLTLFFLCLFFMQPISLSLWQKFALLRQFQFSWRLLSLVTLATALASFSFFQISSFKKKRPFFLLIFLVVLTSLAYWRPPEGFDRIEEADYWNFPLNTTYFGEANTIWAGNPPESYPDQRVAIIEGEGEVAQFTKQSNQQRFRVLAETEVNLVSRTIFFPGWRVFADQQPVPIEFQDQNYRGLITFRLPPGEHQVEIKFGRTKDRLISETISLVSFCLLIVGSLYLYYNHIRRKK
ncbi:MAG: hypothetical protein MUP45_02880 [Candidatus Marinimicrobia bacterium]|nr:hypothetical protein [Candidatus Neomarinimicrobiota bacterium]